MSWEAAGSGGSAKAEAIVWMKSDEVGQRLAADALEAYWVRELAEYEVGLDAALERLFLTWRAQGKYVAEDEAALHSSLVKVRQSWRSYAEAEDALVRRLPVPDGLDPAAYSARCRAVVAMQHLEALHVHAALSLKRSFVFGDEDHERTCSVEEPVAEMPRDDYALHLSRLRDEASSVAWTNQRAEDVAEYWDERLVLFLDALEEGSDNRPPPLRGEFPEDAARAAQEAWLAYRAAMIEALTPLPRYAGTGTPALRAVLRERLTRQRCTNLLFYAGTGDAASGSFIPYTRRR